VIAITSFNLALYEAYAYRLIESLHNWPTPVMVYSEDRLPIPRVDLHAVCPKLVAFKGRCPAVKDYRFDAARFANKVFAFCHGAWNADDLVFWLDADVIVRKPISEQFLRSLIPQGCYAAYFGRNTYTETGFHVVDARHRAHRTFLEEWRKVYLDGTIFRLPQWHDCMAYDFVREQMHSAGVGFHSLSVDPKQSHPIVLSPLGEYLDHTKGPDRKRLGYSPERPDRPEKCDPDQAQRHLKDPLFWAMLGDGVLKFDQKYLDDYASLGS
jgi:hypothetical protein